jgi:hypothetical protein
LNGAALGRMMPRVMNDIVSCLCCRNRIIPTGAGLCPACGRRPDLPPDAEELRQRAAMRLARRRSRRRTVGAVMLALALSVAVVGLALKLSSGGQGSGWFVGATVLLSLVGAYALATGPRPE